MPKRESRGIERKREFSNEKPCHRIVDWLNDSEDDPARARIRELLRNIQVISSNWVEFTDSEDGKQWVRYVGSEKQYRRAATTVKRLLQRYKFSPLVVGGAPRVFTQWTPISGPGGRYKGRWPGTTDGKYDEFFAVYELTWNHGESLNKIKECRCGKWFFVKFSHQKFCSARCRDKANKSSPKWKEYRREKARQYYWLHKNKNTK